MNIGVQGKGRTSVNKLPKGPQRIDKKHARPSGSVSGTHYDPESAAANRTTL